ncbi:hypothetical protein V494_06910 [Pseudogymnoascus sp. VKM F-4513 (FW-928)]|nr:hypothetical protein V494_06910 [Pseudogymnoascus sp. VKM F-4513 (FW-928)]
MPTAMAPKYRNQLPHLEPNRKPFLAEGGLETDLIFRKGVSLPHFAAFTLLDTPEGTQTLRDCYTPYIHLAHRHRTGLILQTPTWRLSEPWARRLNYADPADKVINASRESVELLASLRDEYETEDTPIVISGSLGSLADAYKSTHDTPSLNGPATARSQISALAAAGVDMLALMTTSSPTEAIAIIELARDAGLPITVSFSLETDGTLLGGRAFGIALSHVDGATDGYASYFGINCAHPSHFLPVLRTMAPEQRARIGLIRANASDMSHRELDNSTVLQRGDVESLADSYKEVMELLPNVVVVGGCCGTDEEHVEAIAERVLGKAEED